MKISICFVFVCCFGMALTLPARESRRDIELELKRIERLLQQKYFSINSGRFNRRLSNHPDKPINQGQRSQKTKDDDDKPIDTLQIVDPDDPLSNLFEGMVIENNGQEHSVLGLHPEKSAKTLGDSHDKHKLTQKQKDYYEQNKNNGGTGRKRNFITYTNVMWSKGVVPFVYDSVPTSTVDVVSKAVQQFNDNTCVRWVSPGDPLVSNLGHNNKIVIKAQNDGCWSYIGNVDPNRDNNQVINLESPACTTVSTAVHEMLHAMGGEHEQSRTDRDQYVKILWDNVNGGTGNNNMGKSDTQDNNPYDAESVMQYGLYSFSTNGQKTIKFKDSRLEFLADAADGLEFYDIQDVTDAYKCADHCTNAPTCQNGGFVNFQCVCFCPDGLTGNTCEQTVSNSPTCGGVINIGQGEIKDIKSPNFGTGNYPTGLECTWLIKGTSGSLVRASLQSMDISSDNTCNHWLEYRYNLLGQKGPKRCGQNLIADSEVWDSTPDELGNAMIIKFNSNMFSDRPASAGFHITVKNIGSGCSNNPCFHGRCDSPDGTSYTCVCDQGYSGTNCDVVSTSTTFSCGFEIGEKCIFNDETNDNMDWSYQTQSTPSSNTGPDQAHSGSSYVYMEASSPAAQGDKAILSTIETLPSIERCMSFWYNMHGGSIGSLNVYTEGTTAGSKTQIWNKSGNQGNTWFQAKIDIPVLPVGLKISFEAVRGSNWDGDIALDDVMLTPGTCSQTTLSSTTRQPTTTTARPTTTRQPTTTTQQTTQPTTTWQPTTTQQTTTQWTGDPVVLACHTSSCLNGGTCSEDLNTPFGYTCSCDAHYTGQDCELYDARSVTVAYCGFEDNEDCFLQNVHLFDDFDWSVTSGSTPSSGTGPSSAFGGSKYAYIETSSPTSTGDVAVLSTSELRLSDATTYCIQFYYHMFGLPGQLSVKVGSRDSTESTIWNMAGDQGNRWIFAQVEIPSTYNDPVISLEGEKGSSFTGDISVDNVVLRKAACPSSDACTSNPCHNQGSCLTNAAGYTCACPSGFTGSLCEVDDSTPSHSFSCGFEQGDTCIFENIKGDDFDWTERSGSTPSSGTGPSSSAEGGFYIYIETSSPIHSYDEAVLSTEITSLASLQDSPFCLNFMYHMYGKPGNLEVLAGERGTALSQIWLMSGDQGNQWNRADIDIPQTNDPVIEIIGNKGSSWRGDIAIDDLHLTSGSCHVKR